MIYLQLFLSFAKVGLFSIGGGYAALPLIQNEIVMLHRWLSMSEFTDLITIAEMTPGPMALNAATFVGTRITGTGGALVATFGCILPSCIIASLLAYVYRRYRNLSTLQNILSCLRPVVMALIAAAGLSILQLVIFSGGNTAMQNIDWLGFGLFSAALLILRWKKTNPILTMSICGIIYTAIRLAFA